MNRPSLDLRTLAASLLLMSLDACTLGPDYQTQPGPLPAQYVRTQASPSGDSTPRLDDQHAPAQAWWLAFASPQLNALVRSALAHNPSLASAQAALSQAEENAAAQYSSTLPQVQASYTPSRQRYPLGTLSPTLNSNAAVYNLHTAQVSVGYVFDLFGSNRRGVEAARAAVDIQAEQLQGARESLAADTVSTAINLAFLQEQIRLNQALIDDQAEVLRLVEQQAQLGYASGLDVASARNNLAQAQQALPALEKLWHQGQDLLAVLVGTLPAQGQKWPLQPQDLKLPATLPIGLPASLVQRRPDVRAADAAVHEASAQLGVAIASRWPNISLSAAEGGSATNFGSMFSSGDVFWNITGNLTQPLFDFGSLKHRQRAAQAALTQAQASYRSVVLYAFANVADSLQALQDDTQAYEAAEHAEQAAHLYTQHSKSQFDAGYSNRIAWLSARVAERQASLTRLQAQSARYLDTVALDLALGGACPPTP